MVEPYQHISELLKDEGITDNNATIRYGQGLGMIDEIHDSIPKI